jgi:hypothetical protein
MAGTSRKFKPFQLALLWPRPRCRVVAVQLARLRTYILSGNSGSEGGKAVQIASPKGKRPLDSASPTRQAAPEAASAPLAPAKLGDSESSDDDFGPSAPVTKKKRGKDVAPRLSRVCLACLFIAHFLQCWPMKACCLTRFRLLPCMKRATCTVIVCPTLWCAQTRTSL